MNLLTVTVLCGAHLLASELCLGLALKHRLLYSYAHSGHHAVANVGIFIPFTREFFNCAAHMLLESGKVASPRVVCCPLTKE